MSLRWYTTVIDSRDPRALGAWWAETLGWQTIFDTDEEVVIIPGWLTPEIGAEMPWERTGPGLVFVPVPEERAGKNRLHLDLAPHTSDDRDVEIARLVQRGATAADVGQTEAATWTVLHDPEGNEFCVLSSRDD